MEVVEVDNESGPPFEVAVERGDGQWTVPVDAAERIVGGQR